MADTSVLIFGKDCRLEAQPERRMYPIVTYAVILAQIITHTTVLTHSYCWHITWSDPFSQIRSHLETLHDPQQYIRLCKIVHGCWDACPSVCAELATQSQAQATGCGGGPSSSSGPAQGTQMDSPFIERRWVGGLGIIRSMHSVKCAPQLPYSPEPLGPHTQIVRSH